MNEILTKVCFKCSNKKEIKDFYKHSQTKDGYLGKCKICTILDSNIRLQRITSTSEGLEEERKRQRDKYYRLNYKETHKPSYENRKVSNDNYKLKFPEKVKAKNMAQSVKILDNKNQRHHWNYATKFSKDIIEINPKDHAKIHRFIKYDKKTSMYKDLNGVLLDTKQKHLELINKILINF